MYYGLSYPSSESPWRNCSVVSAKNEHPGRFTKVCSWQNLREWGDKRKKGALIQWDLITLLLLWIEPWKYFFLITACPREGCKVNTIGKFLEYFYNMHLILILWKKGIEVDIWKQLLLSASCMLNTHHALANHCIDSEW